VSSSSNPPAIEGAKPLPKRVRRRDALMLVILIAAVLLLIWNGSTFFRQIMLAGADLGHEARVASTALTLNVALILFGWRQYVDLLHEAEMRADGEQRAAILATTDAHSGLLNRKGFADRAQALAQRGGAAGQNVAIVSLQINRFKAVNDRHGYEVGDTLLRELAAAMIEALPAGAEIARLSGDEFAVALALEPDGNREVEQAAESALHAVTSAFSIDGRVIQVGAFAGIAVAPASEARIPDLLRRADIAMEHARSARAARAVWFDAGMERALIAQSELEQGIRYGLEHDQFVPYFEPQLDLETGEIVGFEVLARWIHPLSGVILPDRFIGVAEEIGLIGRLSERIIREALAQAIDWDPAIKISVNISPVQLTDAWLAQRIVRLLTEIGFPAERLVVEITESSLFTDLDVAGSIVTSLKNQGVRLALDDFGTGFSSLSHLRSLPFDVIKIDRSFVANIHSNKESSAIIRAVTTLAGALEVPVYVEGIETEADHAAVLGLGCAVGQGWYFGKPMAGEQAAQMLAERHHPPLQTAPKSAAG
jgi:diguanylate cyclase (GGDEF)-like protein